MIEVKGNKKEQEIREWLNAKHGGSVPTGKIKDILEAFLKDNKKSSVSYSSMNGVLKKVTAEGAPTEPEDTSDEPEVKKPFVFKTIKVEDLDTPDFKLHKSGKPIDLLFSDHEEGGGIYGGTVNIVIGESGVGKSTVLLDMLASIEANTKGSKGLYISSEMTQNDISFYYKKTPSIGKVTTLLVMDYVKDNTLDEALDAAFNADYDIIILDSFQDVIVKLKEIKGWRANKAESWLIGKMIDASEKKGCAILAIQHMTKGGTYVGSTYLKHATQAMVEIKFDLAGNRYVEFDKNRRGGSATGKRLYYTLVDGEVVYDMDRFKESEDMRQIERSESMRRVDLAGKFDDIFKRPVKKEGEEEVVEEKAD